MSHIAGFAVRSSESELMTFYLPVVDDCLDKCSLFISVNYVPFRGIFFFMLLVSGKFKSVRISASGQMLKSLLCYYC
jgi:hypothetical protein